MAGPRRIFLAWKNLTHDRRRLALGVAAVTFAVLLMFMQFGFRNAMFDSTVAAIDGLNADLVIASSVRYTLSVSETFSRRRLLQAESCPGVAHAYPLYIESRIALFTNPETGIAYPIRVLAFDPDDPAFRDPAIGAQQHLLTEPMTVLFDTASKSDYGPIATGTHTMLAGKQVRVVGTFHLGTDFANDGNLLASPQTLERLFRKPLPGSDALGPVDLGLVQLAPGANARAVRDELAALLPDDVAVYTKREFREREMRFWRENTPIGYVFGMGLAMGFIVGVVICYQILYTDIEDHMGEFATLKAIGYHGGFFLGLVAQEALLLALFGFVPGLAIAAVLYTFVSSATGLAMDLTVARAGFILLLTTLMCGASALLAIRKVFSADPAELF